MKRVYESPQIERIILDNEISLELQSSPTPFPDEINLSYQNQAIQNPYQQTV